MATGIANRRAKRTGKQIWERNAEVNRFDDDTIPRVFGHRPSRLVDTLLVALAVGGPLTAREAAPLIGVRFRAISDAFVDLRARGLVTGPGRRGRLATPYALDERHPGYPHLLKYLRHLAPLLPDERLRHRRPAYTGPLRPFRLKPTLLFNTAVRTRMLLAIAISPQGLLRSEVLAAMNWPRTNANNHGATHAMRYLTIRGLVTASKPAHALRRNLNPDFPGMAHLRAFLRAHAVAFEPRLVERVFHILQFGA